ncbi:hypothetical protein ACS7ZM_002571 [Enterococcus faecalis]
MSDNIGLNAIRKNKTERPENILPENSEALNNTTESDKILNNAEGVTGTSIQKIAVVRHEKKQEMLLNHRFLFFSFSLQKYFSGTFVQKIAVGFKTRTF